MLYLPSTHSKKVARNYRKITKNGQRSADVYFHITLKNLSIIKSHKKVQKNDRRGI